MYDCEGYGGEFVFVYYELPKLEPLEYTGIEPLETVTESFAVDRAAQAFLLSGPLKSQKTKC